ncbi:helix-turn-helix domain-containing protein [Pantoea agglomerans]|uniref:helix-turn-helix domain-containing protein n=1 Tax=Enterobacter agglomerans TaxID=549 RepID=UPI003EE90D83
MVILSGLKKCRRLQFFLLSAEMKISDIAEKFHFESQQTFTRAFTRHFGMPPGVWRMAYGAP